MLLNTPTGNAPENGERCPGTSDQSGRLSEASPSRDPTRARRAGGQAAGDVASPSTRTWAASEAEAQFLALPEISWSTYQSLLRRGIPSSALVYPELPRLTSVVFHPKAPLFDFEEDGVSALAFLARDDTGEPADIVAWSWRNKKVAAHFGAIGVLGADAILAPRLTEEGALAVHRSPLGWLRAGREGAVIIESRRATVELRDVGPLCAEDEAHALMLRRMFRDREPTIYLPDRSPQ